VRRLLVLALLAVTACTPAQTRAWLRWHAEDPHAAVAFLDTDAGREILADDGTDEPQFLEWLVTNPTPGDCASYEPLLAAYGLPVATFRAIAWRESGCNHESYVIDSDDAGGGLLGINLKGYQQATTYYRWCGVTLATVTDAETNVRCAAEAYRRMGLAPWRTS
jgi:hypothetical protein